MPKKFHIATFGCRTNQADSAAIRQDFLDSRFEETQDWADADVIVVNSCTVTHRSDQQVRQLTRRLRRDNPSARLMLTGCYAQRDPQGLAALEGVDAVVGNTRKTDLVQLSLGQEASARTPGSSGYAAVYCDDFSRVRAVDLAPATQMGGRTRPFVKIQDGCDAKCTYCIIPSVRGPSRSVPPQQILSQVRRLVESGFREVVLTGIHIGTYGLHMHPRYPLHRLLGEIVEIPRLQRLRISSIEPMELSRRIIDLAAACDTIAPHFHICLQSGSDRILKRMLRPYGTSRFASIVEEIRERLPDAAIGTDIIVGFPGESEGDHLDSLEFAQRMPFTYLHVFPYSDRSGTAASSMQGKIDPETRKERSRRFRELSAAKSAAFRRRHLGRTISLLTLSEIEDGRRVAISGNYLKAKLDPKIEGNRMIEAQAVAEEGDCLIAQALAPA